MYDFEFINSLKHCWYCTTLLQLLCMPYSSMQRTGCVICCLLQCGKLRQRNFVTASSRSLLTASCQNHQNHSIPIHRLTRLPLTQFPLTRFWAKGISWTQIQHHFWLLLARTNKITVNPLLTWFPLRQFPLTWFLLWAKVILWRRVQDHFWLLLASKSSH